MCCVPLLFQIFFFFVPHAVRPDGGASLRQEDLGFDLRGAKVASPIWSGPARVALMYLDDVDPEADGPGDPRERRTPTWVSNQHLGFYPKESFW